VVNVLGAALVGTAGSAVDTATGAVIGFFATGGLLDTVDFVVAVGFLVTVGFVVPDSSTPTPSSGDASVAGAVFSTGGGAVVEGRYQTTLMLQIQRKWSHRRLNL
jgi:hypothetical protein